MNSVISSTSVGCGGRSRGINTKAVSKETSSGDEFYNIYDMADLRQRGGRGQVDVVLSRELPHHWTWYTHTHTHVNASTLTQAAAGRRPLTC